MILIYWLMAAEAEQVLTTPNDFFEFIEEQIDRILGDFDIIISVQKDSLKQELKDFSESMKKKPGDPGEDTHPYFYLKKGVDFLTHQFQTIVRDRCELMEERKLKEDLKLFSVIADGLCCYEDFILTTSQYGAAIKELRDIMQDYADHPDGSRPIEVEQELSRVYQTWIMWENNLSFSEQNPCLSLEQKFITVLQKKCQDFYFLYIYKNCLEIVIPIERPEKEALIQEVFSIIESKFQILKEWIEQHISTSAT